MRVGPGAEALATQSWPAKAVAWMGALTRVFDVMLAAPLQGVLSWPEKGLF